MQVPKIQKQTDIPAVGGLWMQNNFNIEKWRSFLYTHKNNQENLAKKNNEMEIILP